MKKPPFSLLSLPGAFFGSFPVRSMISTTHVVKGDSWAAIFPLYMLQNSADFCPLLYSARGLQLAFSAPLAPSLFCHHRLQGPARPSPSPSLPISTKGGGGGHRTGLFRITRSIATNPLSGKAPLFLHNIAPPAGRTVPSPFFNFLPPFLAVKAALVAKKTLRDVCTCAKGFFFAFVDTRLASA